MDSYRRKVARDALIVIASVAAAFLLSKSPLLDELVSHTSGFVPLDSFITGLFFTSAFTTAPAIIVLGKLGASFSPYLVAFFGGLGAVIGDLLIFTFLKKHVSEDVSHYLFRSKRSRGSHVFKYRFFRWSLALLGAIVIASPLPDELGLTLMGVSNIRKSWFVLISFSFNFIGILMIAFLARSI